MFGYIYKIVNTLNGKVYIGKKKGPYNKKYWGSGVLIKEAIKKHGKQNFTLEVLCYCDTQEELNEKERYYISTYNCTERDIGYNLAYGGDGGDTLSLMSKDALRVRNVRLSNSQKGHVVTEEARKKISEAQRKNWATNKQRRSVENASVRRRPEVRASISKAHKKLWKSKSRRKKASMIAKIRCSNPDYMAKQHTTRATPSYKSKMSTLMKGKTKGYKFYNNGIIEVRVSPEAGQELLQNGYKLGRLPFSEETKRKLSEAAKRRKKQ